MLQLTVIYDSGETVEVNAGQREMAKWEREPFGCASTKAGDTSPVVFFRYLAWAALWRTRQLPKDDDGKTLDWPSWDAIVESVDPPDDGGEEADPTNPDRSPAA